MGSGVRAAAIYVACRGSPGSRGRVPGSSFFNRNWLARRPPIFVPELAVPPRFFEKKMRFFPPCYGGFWKNFWIFPYATVDQPPLPLISGPQRPSAVSPRPSAKHLRLIETFSEFGPPSVGSSPTLTIIVHFWPPVFPRKELTAVVNCLDFC